jgi:hypothetical protein
LGCYKAPNRVDDQVSKTKKEDVHTPMCFELSCCQSPSVHHAHGHCAGGT